MTSDHHSLSGSVLTSVVTAFVVSLPEPVVNYAGKLVSVVVLAMAAEVGRRFVSWLATKGKGDPK